MLSFEQICELTRQALRSLLGDGYSIPGWNIVATFIDSVVVSRGPASAKLVQYPLEVSADAVKLGEPTPVELAYQALLTEATRSLAQLPMSAELAEGERAKGGRWAVRVIAEGLSQNRVLYPGDVLRRAAHLYEGARVFMNHAKDPSEMRDPLQAWGRIRKPRYAMMEATGQGAIFADLVALPRLHEFLTERADAGELDMAGLSHEAEGQTEKVKLPEGWVDRATSIDRVKSVDVVSFPAAGGAFTRLVAGLPYPISPKEDAMLEELIRMLEAQRPDLFKRLSATPTEGEVRTLLQEAMKPVSRETPPAPVPAPAPAPAPAPTPDAGRLSEAERSLIAQSLEAANVIRADSRRRLIESTVAGVALPAAATAALRADLEALDAALTPEIAKARADAKVAEVAALLEGVTGYGSTGNPGVQFQRGGDSDTKAVDHLYDLLMSDADPKTLAEGEKLLGRKVGRLDSYSIKDVYYQVTGDSYYHNGHQGQALAEGLKPMSRLTPMLRNPSRLVEGRRMCEGLGVTSTWAELMQDALYVRMLAEYRAQGLTDWRKVAQVINANDFKTQHAVRWGGYADSDIAIVPEGDAYPEATTPGDEEVTYAVSKKGVTEFITWEAMVNDRLGFIRNIPIKLGRAAARKLFKFVLYDLLASNPTMPYDSTALFHTNHGNTAATALSAASVAVARQQLLDQTELGGNDKLGLRMSWLMVPSALETVAWRLVNSPVALVSGQNATEPNPEPRFGLNDLIVNLYLSDTDNWFAGVAKGDAPMIEVAFLYGQEEPVLVIADSPTVGDYFRADRIGHKLKHVYGGAPVDHRGLVGNFTP